MWQHDFLLWVEIWLPKREISYFYLTKCVAVKRSKVPGVKSGRQSWRVRPFKRINTLPFWSRLDTAFVLCWSSLRHYRQATGNTAMGSKKFETLPDKYVSMHSTCSVGLRPTAWYHEDKSKYFQLYANGIDPALNTSLRVWSFYEINTNSTQDTEGKREKKKVFDYRRRWWLSSCVGHWQQANQNKAA